MRQGRATRKLVFGSLEFVTVDALEPSQMITGVSIPDSHLGARNMRKLQTALALFIAFTPWEFYVVIKCSTLTSEKNAHFYCHTIS